MEAKTMNFECFHMKSQGNNYLPKWQVKKEVSDLCTSLIMTMGDLLGRDRCAPHAKMRLFYSV